MANKKNFTAKENPAMRFITTEEAAANKKEQAAKKEPKKPAQAAKAAANKVEISLEELQNLVLPKGYSVAKERKSERMQLLVRPSLKEGIKAAADADGISANDFINDFFERYLSIREAAATNNVSLEDIYKHIFDYIEGNGKA